MSSNSDLGSIQPQDQNSPKGLGSNPIAVNVVELHTEMRQLTIQAGILEKKYDSVIVDLEQRTPSQLQQLLDWLTSVYKNSYKEVKVAWELVPASTWETYKVMGLKGLREQRLLKQAQYELKRAWDKPYRTEEQLERIARRKGPNKHGI